MDTSPDTEHQEASCACVENEISVEEALELLSLKNDVIKAMTDHLNDVTRTMSGYAGMLERHLSIQDDTIGSEYAVGVRGGLEQLQTLLHHLRPLTRQRKAKLAESEKLMAQLKQAIDNDK